MMGRAIHQILVLATSILTVSSLAAQDRLFCQRGSVTFRSEAPLEIISATSRAVNCVLDTHNGAFAFTIDMRSFEGFNSPIQRTHFLENYIEAKKFPSATFTGKVIERIEFGSQNEIQIRAKGILSVHGVSHERIIVATLAQTENGLKARATFKLLLAEYGIKVPKIVQQKIANTIHIEVDIELDHNA